MKKRMYVAICALLATVLAVCSCSTDIPHSHSGNASDESLVTLNKQSVSLPIGGTYTLIATVKPESKDTEITWKSSDEKAVTVTDGLVTAIVPGEYTVTATAGEGNKAQCTVTVRERPESDASSSTVEGGEGGTDTGNPQGNAGAGAEQNSCQNGCQTPAEPNQPQGQSPSPAQPQSPAPPQSQAPEPHTPVWVVTKPAWTEQVPIYETVEREICNNCGGDMTGTSMAEHRQATGNSACGPWHSEWIEIIVGYKEVYHPEEGYWK